jgi:sec-independent protein translocase protein TatC
MAIVSSPLRRAGHAERLTTVDHLSELRIRLLVCAATLAVAFSIGLWQSRGLLDVLNRPLQAVTAGQSAPGDQLTQALDRTAGAFGQLAQSATLTADDRHAAAVAAASLHATANGTVRPVTLGLGEPFTTSLTVALAFALIVALPVLLWQAYAFVIPAVSPAATRGVRLLLSLVPVLFAAGVVFAYVVVLPPAVRFLQGFNDGAFTTFVQARDFYRFELATMLAVGVVFQLPVGLLALARAGVVSSAGLRSRRRLAIVVLAVLAALLPGTDPVTTLLELVPLVALYELGIVLVRCSERRASRGARNTE